jgi:hypothetical protein
VKNYVAILNTCYEELFDMWCDYLCFRGLDGVGLGGRLAPKNGNRSNTRTRQIGDFFEITVAAMWCKNDPKVIWELVESIRRSRLEWEYNVSGQAEQFFANSLFWSPNPGSVNPPTCSADEQLSCGARWELCHSLSTSDPPRTRQLVIERPWESDAGISGGQQDEADANMVDIPGVHQDAGGSRTAETGADEIGLIDRPVPLILP